MKLCIETVPILWRLDESTNMSHANVKGMAILCYCLDLPWLKLKLFLRSATHVRPKNLSERFLANAESAWSSSRSSSILMSPPLLHDASSASLHRCWEVPQSKTPRSEEAQNTHRTVSAKIEDKRYARYGIENVQESGESVIAVSRRDVAVRV